MEEKRINSGYEIIESHTIGSNELVIGHNPRSTQPPMCVGTAKTAPDYFWGILLQSVVRSKEEAE